MNASLKINGHSSHILQKKGSVLEHRADGLNPGWSAGVELLPNIIIILYGFSCQLQPQKERRFIGKYSIFLAAKIISTITL